MKSMIRVRRALWSTLALALVSLPCGANLVVTHVTPMSGPNATEAAAHNLGIRVAIEAVNSRGGVNSQKVVLKTLDDEYKPDRTIELIRQEGAGESLALLLPIGSVAMTRVLKEKILESLRIPVVGVIPGSGPLRSPTNPYLYHVRAGDLDQYQRIVEHVLTVGMKRIAVVYSDIPMGKSGLATIESLLKARSIPLEAAIPFPVSAKIDFSNAIGQLRQKAPDVIVVVSPPFAAGQFVRDYHNAGLTSPIMTLSYGDAETLCSIAGADKAKGVGVAQVFPNVNSPTIPVSRRFQEDFKRHGIAGAAVTQNNFEGYVTAQVVIEALKRVGPAPTREKLVKALDSMKATDIGGFMVDFSSSRHTGSQFVDIGIISHNCKLVF